MNRGLVFYQRDAFLYLLAIFFSLLLSVEISLREAIINPDAICYLGSAAAINNHGLFAAMHFCPQAQWPFYSLLIYAVVKITFLPYTLAAYLINSLLSLASVLFFILIIKELGGSRRSLWLAALVILLAHEFNSVRQYIVRDHGFWAFYLASILLLLRYFRQPRWTMAFAWSGSLILASLFRIEGAIFLLALPFISWINFRDSWIQRAQHFFILYLPIVIIASSIIAWLAWHPQRTLTELGRIAEIPNQLQHGILLMNERYQASKAALAQYVLTQDSAREAGLVLFTMLIAWYLLSVLANLSFAYSALVIYAWRRAVTHFTSSQTAVLLAYLTVNIIITFGFLLERLFFSKRYLVGLSLVLMLWVPFALENLIKNWRSLPQRTFLLLMLLLMMVSSVSGIFNFGYSKVYIRDSGNWLTTHVPAQAALYVNDYQLMYYSQHFGEDIFKKIQTYADINSITHGKWRQYDYIALRVKKHAEKNLALVLKEIALTPEKIFSNKRGDRVVIYKIAEKRS